MRTALSSFRIFAVAVAVLGASQPANAGFLDKINAATQKINQASQQMEQRSQQLENARATTQRATPQAKTKTTNPITGEWGTQKTCEHNSATCQNGMDDLVNCMNQIKGYYYRLVAENLKTKLEEQELSEEERIELEADIVSVEEAIATNTVVDPDPENPQRWLHRLSKDDQKQINGMNSKYMNEVRTDCDARFGGMARYSNR